MLKIIAMCYFAYGSNMARQRIENRLNTVKCFGVGLLDKYEIKLAKFGRAKTWKQYNL